MNVPCTLCEYFKPKIEIVSSWGILSVARVLKFRARAVAEMNAITSQGL